MTQAPSFEVSGAMDDLRSSDKDRQNRAFAFLLAAIEGQVDWAYAVWDELLRLVTEGDNRQRSIASQVLAGLSASDPEQRIVRDFDALLNVTRDERFVTARHCLLSLWKVAAAGETQKNAVIDGLARRFSECAAEKNCTLIRYDILAVFRRVFDLTGDPAVRSAAAGLIALESDAKYKKKYATLWRGAPQG